MAKHRADKTPQSESPQQSLNNPSDSLLEFAILAGVAVLIVITGLNLYETHRQRTELTERMAQLIAALGTKAETPAPRPTGPDPNRAYTVKTEGSPFTGPKGARP